LRLARRRFQIVFQDPMSSLNPRWSVRSVIAEPLSNFLALSPGEINERVASLLADVGLPANYAGKLPHQLSGGERQRVAIARSLALQPRLVVCDEPVSSLDVSIQAQILNLFRELQQRVGLACLFISHNLAVLKHVSHRLAIMYLGRIVESAPVEALFAQPLHPYTHALLSSIPRPDPRLERARVPIAVRGELPGLQRGLPPGCLFHPRCPYGRTLCSEEVPAFRELATGHWAACHFPLDTPMSPGGDVSLAKRG
jgi:peptide/nickel transport system ATP-binding protein